MVGTTQPLCLLRQEPMGVATTSMMNLRKNRITAPRYNTGWMTDLFQSEGVFFLTSPFIERHYRNVAFFSFEMTVGPKKEKSSFGKPPSPHR